MITGKRVLLRKVKPSDIDVLLDWENDQENWQYSDSPKTYSKDTMQQFVNSVHDLFISHQLRFMIIHEEKYIGCIDLYEFDPIHLRAGVGILIDKKFRNKGYAKESILSLKEYAFKTLKINQLHCMINVKNNKSLDLFKSCGFKISGTMNSWIRRENEWEDVIFLQCFYDDMTV